MATTKGIAGAIMAPNGRHGIGGKLAAGAATLGCAAALAFGALLADGGARHQYSAANIGAPGNASPTLGGARLEALLADGTRPGFVAPVPGDIAPVPEHGWAISDGTRPGLVP